MKRKQNKFVVFGPFIGEFLWELHYFIPHFIYRSRRKRGLHYIAITREKNIDLYGRYVDIFCPLAVDVEPYHFSSRALDMEAYNSLINKYLDHFRKKYDIEEYVIPRVEYWKKDIKWQFPRDETDYNFLPRIHNKKLVKSSFRNVDRLILNDSEKNFYGYRNITSNYIKEIYSKNRDMNTSYYGILIEYLKLCDFYVGPFNEIAHLAMLMKIPVISEKIGMEIYELKVINPMNSIVIENNYSEGVRMYEDNFRSSKNRIR